MAPRSGYYFFAATLQFSGGNGQGDGVIVGIYNNGDSNDNNTTIIVVEPGLIKNSTAQSITAMMKLDPKDRVDVRLEGVDKSTFTVSYSSFMGFLIGQ
ncbi:MAG: hypothetical protein F6K64_18760 [Moorea sp. SIO3A2]|nr:hypothetical protein [Moorena sp. SIO3A5]NER88937.1 hypothetical protein [Moorena sp. SIO3A2]